MDSTSIGIILTSMALSAITLLLFKLDFFTLNDSRPVAVSTKVANNATKSALTNGKSSANNCAIKSENNKSNYVKQVHFAETILTRTLNEPSKNNKYNNYSTTNAKQHHGASKSTKKNKNICNANLQHNQDNIESNNLNSSSFNKIDQHDATLPAMAINLEPNAIELSSEGDVKSTVLLDVINTGKTGVSSKQKSWNNAQTNEKKSTRRRQNSDQVSYSSEKLFAMIASSNLSNDEVQLAVETLLNKLDSAETEWRRPKSDPIQRLKNQIRDIENNLSTETQNHKQTRARLNELKTELQTEKSAKSSVIEELAKVKKEFNSINVALEKTQYELTQHKSIQDQIGNGNSKLIGKLEQDNAKLQTLLANKSGVHGDELTKLHSEFEVQENKLKHYELANQNLSKTIQELESNLQQTELKLDQLLSSKRRDDFDARNKIADLDSSRQALEETLKDQIQHLTELTKTNNLLEKSVNELQIMNGRQDDMLTRMRDERHANEQSLKRTLCEMEQELRELQAKLSSKSSANDERFREEINHFERELNYADRREQTLVAKMHQLRQGLSDLFPDLMHSSDTIQEQQDNLSDDWVHQYLAAFRQLAVTVDELRRANDGNNNSSDQLDGNSKTFGRETPCKSSNGRNSPMRQTNGSTYSRKGSPSSSRPNSRASDHEKRLMETKLVELSDEVSKLKETIYELETSSKPDNFSDVKLKLERQIKDLTLERDKMKSQIKIGFDSFKMEQRRALELEEELSKYVPIESMS